MNTFLLAAMLALPGGGRAAVAASAGFFRLGNYFSSILADDDPPGSIWSFLTRLLTAMAKILENWPAGQPVNGQSILLALFKAAAVEEIGVRIDAIIQKLLIAPQYTGNLWQGLVLIATIPAFAIMLGNGISYFRRYNRLTSDEQMRVVADIHPSLISPWRWTVRMLFVMIIIASYALTLGTILAITWHLLFLLVAVFYAPASIHSFGGAMLEVLLKIVQGDNPFMVLISFTMFLLILLWVGWHLLKRYFWFFWQGLILEIDLPKILNGDRETNVATVSAVYLEKMGLLYVTVFLILVGPLFITEFTAVTGIIALAVFWIWSWLVVTRVPDLFDPERRLYYQVREIPYLLTGEKVPDDLSEGEKEVLRRTEDVRAKKRARNQQRVKDVAMIGGAYAAARYPEAAKEYEGFKRTSAAYRRDVTPAEKQHARENLARDTGTRQRKEAEAAQAAQKAAEARERDIAYLRQMPEELWDRLTSLDEDQEMNDAIFFRLLVFYNTETTTHPVDAKTDELRSTLIDIRRDDPKKFAMWARTGKRLRELAIRLGKEKVMNV